MFTVRFTDIHDPYAPCTNLILDRFHEALHFSRFTCEMDSFLVGRIAREWVISFSKIRLCRSKPYCGNHAFSCEIANPGRDHSRPNRRANYLEGADWVAWNDMLNDVLDSYQLSAEAQSSLVCIRHGYARCVEYYARERGGEWSKEGRFHSCINEPLPIHAKYPKGTPGDPQWWISDEYPAFLRVHTDLLDLFTSSS